MSVAALLDKVQHMPEFWQSALYAFSLLVIAIVTVWTSLIRANVSKAAVEAWKEILLHDRETNREKLRMEGELEKAKWKAEVRRLEAEYALTGKATHRDLSTTETTY